MRYDSRMNRPPWIHTAQAAALARTGQFDPRIFTTAPVAVQEPPIVTNLREGLKEITWPLILTGLFLGVFTGLGTTVGSAVGSMIVNRFVAPPRRGRRR